MIRDKNAAAKGVGLGLLIVLSMTYALSVFGTTGFGDIGWTALALGVLFFGALAAPAALRLLREGLVGLPGAALSVDGSPGGKGAERQLLEAIARHGEITPVRAALETTLTVGEADRMLGDLASAGHLSVGTEDGALLYSLPGDGKTDREALSDR